MTVLDSELPKSLTTYVEFVSKINEDGIGSLYGMDNLRTSLHREMAAAYGLTEEETGFVCEDLDRMLRFCGGDINTVCNALHRKICKIKKENTK